MVSWIDSKLEGYITFPSWQGVMRALTHINYSDEKPSITVLRRFGETVNKVSTKEDFMAYLNSHYPNLKPLLEKYIQEGYTIGKSTNILSGKGY